MELGQRLKWQLPLPSLGKSDPCWRKPDCFSCNLQRFSGHRESSRPPFRTFCMQSPRDVGGKEHSSPRS